MRMLEVLTTLAYTAPHAEIASKTRDRQVGWVGSVRLAVLWLDRDLLVYLRLPDFNGVNQRMGRVL